MTSQRRTIAATTMLAAAVLSCWACPEARADIPVPQPTTFWAEKEIPSGNSIALAGACLSAAVIAAGLIAARLRPLRSGLAKASVASIAGLLVIAISAAAYGFYQQAQRDQQAWEKYQLDEAALRRNWRPPPHLRDEPPPAAAPAPVAQS